MNRSTGRGAAKAAAAGYRRPAAWKTALAVIAVIAAAAAFVIAIMLRGIPGIAIGAALAAGLALPAVWWIRLETREHRAAVDPDAPAAIMDRRWRFIAPIAVVLLAIGSTLAYALPEPEKKPVVEEEQTTHRKPPKPSKPSKSKTKTTTAPTGTTDASTTSSTSTKTSQSTKPSSTTKTPTSQSPKPTSSPKPTTSPEPTSSPKPTQPTTSPQPTQPTTAPKPSQPTQPTQPTQPAQQPPAAQ